MITIPPVYLFISAALKGGIKGNLPLLSVDSHSFSATGNAFGLVDSHDGVTLAVDRNQALVPGIAGTLVRDGTVCRVVPCPEVEMVKEVVSLLFN
jgi:hypothetical protein